MDATLQERTDYSRGFDRGNYGYAYESQDWNTWSRRNNFDKQTEAYREGMLQGFFSNSELSEIRSPSLRRQVEALRAKHGIPGHQKQHTISNQWNKGDILLLTRECEIGYTGEILRVVAVDGPYMTAVRKDGKSFVHTGRDYQYATRIGRHAPPLANLIRKGQS